MKKGFSDDTFLARWLAGRLKEEEQKDFEQQEEYSDFNTIAKGIEQLDMPAFSEETSWQKLLAKKQQAKTIPIRKIRTWRTYSIAASIALILGVSIAFFLSQHTITTITGQKTALQLPDNSKVQLNSNSQVRYNRLIWKFNRKLSLKGEAFFEVEKGNTFEVKTSTGIVSVLGTSFNVWSRNQQLEVTCHTGIVSVKSFNKIIQLTPGEKAVAAAGLLNESRLPSLPLLPPWIKGESKFEEASVKVIIAELERQFDIQIQYDGNLEKKLTLSFPHNSQDAALRLFSGALECTYETGPGKTIVINPKE